MDYIVFLTGGTHSNVAFAHNVQQRVFEHCNYNEGNNLMSTINTISLIIEVAREVI
jgi:hypothetical protein